LLRIQVLSRRRCSGTRCRVVKMHSRNSSLDLLRSLAIILVVNAHTASILGQTGYLHVFQLGGVGVDLFFVLSGWLLGQMLLQELRTTDGIDVKRFWYRRWMRTLPAYYVVLALTFLWQIVRKNNWDLCWSFLLFCQNYSTTFPYFKISWSLCVEEHFYLIIGPLLLIVFRFRFSVWLLPVMMAIPSVCRHMGWYHDLVETHVRYDECGAGVLLAYCSEYLPSCWRSLCRYAPALALGGFMAACYNVVLRVYPSWGKGDLPITVWCLIFSSFVLLANSGAFWKHKLRFPLFRYLADRSYAVYLLHPEALAIIKYGGTMSPVLVFILAWGLSLAFAEVLYRAVERPFIQAREWFSATCATQPHRVLSHEVSRIPA
jgi:peptidoglycan/LPS O-acetylase OafA/YrhL